MSEDLEVRVLLNGRAIATIFRPLREIDGQPAITFKKQLWPLVAGSIELGVDQDSTTLKPPSSGTEKVLVVNKPAREAPPIRAPLLQPLPPESEALGQGAPTWQGDPINEPPDARLLVDAGPGTGKTHAACARVAAMVNRGIPATRICLVSFTRTAVVEIRNRIARALEDPADASSVRIVTLDAFAWAIQSGFSQDARLTGSYEDNIQAARRLIREDSDVADDVARIEHLIVDEAQDIVGPRADLVLTMIDALYPESGVTVFADRAQAIYGFAEGHSESQGTNLLDAVSALGFHQTRLTQVHRTADPRLLTIFTDLRHELLEGKRSDMGNHLRKEIQRLAHGKVGDVTKLDLAELPDDSLVLMRNRFDVLLASSRSGLIPHRLRLSGLPICVRAWVAQLFWDYLQRRISRDEFEKRWDARNVHAPFDCNEAWNRCVEVAGDSAVTIDLHKLRRVLSRTNPPMIFCMAEFGTAGPIIGTIHASKGREAPTVYLYLQDRHGPDKTGEEARVIFVGATRARERLLVGTTGMAGGSHTNGRVWRRAGDYLQVEVGRHFDLEPPGLVGRPFFTRQDDAMTAQMAWRSQSQRQSLTLRVEEGVGWQFTLTDGEQRLAGMSESFRSDIRQIAWHLNKHIGWLGHVRSIGLRTMVVAPESPYLDTMLEPWKSSGFLFSPLLTSLSIAKPRSR
ncbi:UvrD-helicase domain-containing protein [Xanthomonas hortorum]|uniref:UvrD-helicase domain-containing protein n=1 Tax=Xanthomonas hortorum TaxID=56454 RepID=UPI001593C4EE|nr:UvrD-helicase domain-containing protein [Xanthomonas hortorum]NHF65988.1 hypothetical protein [Xanthomonas hortorum]